VPDIVRKTLAPALDTGQERNGEKSSSSAREGYCPKGISFEDEIGVTRALAIWRCIVKPAKIDHTGNPGPGCTDWTVTC
jgi:hypothetical protein